MLLATCEAMPDGEGPGTVLVDALAAMGVDARWAVWDDPDVDWSAADAVAVRSTWDYTDRLPRFLDWAASVEAQVPLLNGAEVFAWNSDKAYLLDLAEDLPVVPTRLVEAGDLPAGLQYGLVEHGEVVLKPRVGASGIGVVVADHADDPRLSGLTDGPWLLQPVVGSVRTTGEISVFVLGVRAASQVRKVATAADIRVHEEYGGSTRAVPLEDGPVSLAERAVGVVAERFGRPPTYARVDLLEHAGRLVVSEVELIEPGLYLDIVPGNAEAFARAVAGTLG